MYVISSKWIPADFTGGDDVATWKYKSTCGEGGGSFCCSVSALCVYVLFTVVCPLYIENILWQLARNKSLTRSVSDCVPLLARVSSRVVTHTICALLVWERSCPHCLRMSMRTLRFRRVLFEEGALSSAPRGSSPTLAEAERRLKSWGSQMDLTERIEREGESSEEGESASVERDEAVDLPPQSVSFEELLEVVTRAVAKLNIELPTDKERQEHPKSKLDEHFLHSRSPLASYLSPSGASSLKAPVLPTKPLRTTTALVGKSYMAAGQAAGCLHTMAVLQAYQAELLGDLDEEDNKIRWYCWIT